MNKINLEIKKLTKELLDELDRKNLIMTFKPCGLALNPPRGMNGDCMIYESREYHGPHRLICVGCNRFELELATHGDNEEFLIPPQEGDVKPVYLVICHLDDDEIKEKDANGTLSADDFTCIDLYSGDWESSMFTMPKGVYHCEVTPKGLGKFGWFFVTEPKNAPSIYLDLEKTQVTFG